MPAPAGAKGHLGSKGSAGSKVSGKSSTSKAGTSEKSSASTSKANKEFELPALSLPYVPKVPATASELEKLKKKTIRRNAPPGEDLKCINIILRTIKGKDVTVQEFISLIAPSTADQGAILRTVMNDDLASFRRLAKKVYETITQDNSDVLLNQQLQLAEYYREKKSLLHTKMMNAIEEIYMMAPDFDFDRYGVKKEKYLEELFPLPEELKVEPEEIEMMKRQAAYHRLQWLRSEGERLNEENNSLKKRLKQMKQIHMEEQRKMAQVEKMVEAKKESLEATQAEKRETLELLNQSLEKTIIAQEISMRQEKDQDVLAPISPKVAALRKKKSKVGVRKKRPKWNELAASEIESRVLEEGRANELAKVEEPFHFSPEKTPEPRQLSPFHYSPPSSAYVSPPRAELPQQARQPQRALPPTRRALAPQDTWGGFY